MLPVPSSENPQSRVAKLAAGVAPSRVSPAGENSAPDPEFRMIITAPASRPCLVQVYEPRQSPEQEEVILEEFPLDGGETARKEHRSATAAFRFLPLTEQVRVELEQKRLRREDPAQLTVGQQGWPTPETEEEMAAGEERQQNFEAAEDAPLESPQKRRVSGGAERAGTAEDEVQRGTSDAQAVPAGHKDETVGEHLARRQTAPEPEPRKRGRPPSKVSTTKVSTRNYSKKK